MMVVTICCLIVTACREDQSLDPQEAVQLPQGKIAKQIDIKDQNRGGKVSFEIRADDPTVLEWFDNECLTVQFDVLDDATDSEEAHEDLPTTSGSDNPTEIGQKFVSIRMSGIFAQDAAAFEYYSSQSKNYSVRFSPVLVERLRVNHIAIILQFEDTKITSTDRHCETGCTFWNKKKVALSGDGGNTQTGVKTYWATGGNSTYYWMAEHYFYYSLTCSVCAHNRSDKFLRRVWNFQDVLTGYTVYANC